MKFGLAFLICLAICFPIRLNAQSTSESLPEELPHQIGLVDMAHIFKNSHEFLSQMESLQKAIKQTDVEAKAIVDRIRELQGQLKSGERDSLSPEFARTEEQITKGKAELETFKRSAQQRFLRQEAEIYKAFYLEVEEAVRKYAIFYKYTLILRFDRQAEEKSAEPGEVMNGMNRQVVFHQSQDDITEPILRYLNEGWKNEGGKVPASLSSHPGTQSGGMDGSTR